MLVWNDVVGIICPCAVIAKLAEDLSWQQSAGNGAKPTVFATRHPGEGRLNIHV